MFPTHPPLLIPIIGIATRLQSSGIATKPRATNGPAQYIHTRPENSFEVAKGRWYAGERGPENHKSEGTYTRRTVSPNAQSREKLTSSHDKAEDQKLVENLERPDRKERPKIPSATKRVHDQNRVLGWDGQEIEEVEPGMPNYTR